uniref:Uncharacterized protein n=1 Tax=Anopheles atroparvus TaxID=41427 RepID=A0A182IV62_ANOAO
MIGGGGGGGGGGGAALPIVMLPCCTSEWVTPRSTTTVAVAPGSEEIIVLERIVDLFGENVNTVRFAYVILVKLLLVLLLVLSRCCCCCCCCLLMTRAGHLFRFLRDECIVQAASFLPRCDRFAIVTRSTRHRWSATSVVRRAVVQAVIRHHHHHLSTGRNRSAVLVLVLIVVVVGTPATPTTTNTNTTTTTTFDRIEIESRRSYPAGGGRLFGSRFSYGGPYVLRSYALRSNDRPWPLCDGGIRVSSSSVGEDHVGPPW